MKLGGTYSMTSIGSFIRLVQRLRDEKETLEPLDWNSTLEDQGPSIIEYHKWLGEQGVVGLPRSTYTPYLEFEDPHLATIFMLKWL